MFFVVIGLIGGLALFLYGMQITSEGLKSTFGNKLKQILSTLSKNKLIALFTGIILTFTIQSSTAVGKYRNYELKSDSQYFVGNQYGDNSYCADNRL